MDDLDAESAKAILSLMCRRFPSEVKSIIDQRQPDPGADQPAAGFCICGKCATMDRATMNVCCGQRPCITEGQTFSDLCLKHSVVEVAGILNYADHFFDTADLSSSKFRNQSYRFFILWQHGKLGQHNRKCPPSCVVLAIRRQFPSVDGNYTGYESFNEDNE